MQLMMIRKKSATSIVEYMSLAIIIIGGLIVIQPYVVRALSGSWKKSGDSFGMGRRFNSKTIECDYAQLDAASGIWYDATCYHGESQDCKVADINCENTAMKACQTDFCSQR